MKWYSVYFTYKIENEETEIIGNIAIMANNIRSAKSEAKKVLMKMNGETEFTDCAGLPCIPKFVKVKSAAECQISLCKLELYEDIDKIKRALFDKVTNLKEYFEIFGCF